MSCIFVSSQGYRSRHEDYTCSADYSRFIAEDVVRWAKQHDESIDGPDLEWVMPRRRRGRRERSGDRGARERPR